MIDTLAFAERLEREYGDDPERARRHVRILGDMVEAGVATRRDIDELRTDLQHEIGVLRSEMREMEQRLRGELYGEIAKLAWRMGGMLIAQTAVLVALLRFLPQ
ncbi:MAG: hypothetical protein R3349_09950 [Geminicoccaceae bacterium]|nr:hypothetical protein [Geminicoccaceae bacterium]